VWRLGGEANAITVNQQRELIEIKDQKRGGGGWGTAFAGARAEWENSARRTNISSWSAKDNKNTQ